MDVPTYNALLGYCANATYPDGFSKHDKRNLRRQAAKFAVQDGLLYFLDAARGRRRVVKEDEKLHIVQEAHCSRIGGAHFARDRTHDKIAERYYWVGIMDDVSSFIAACDACQRNATRLNRTVQPLRPMPVVDRVWHMVGIDLITNLPVTPRGNKHIAVCVDLFTKWPEAQAIQHKDAASVHGFLLSLVCRHGAPSIVITDQGRELCNDMVSGFLRSIGTEHRTTSAYHPQTNGQAERFNQTLKAALRRMINENLDDWDLLIDGVLLGYRTSRQSSTRFAPFLLANGRRARLPLDMALNAPTEALPGGHDNVVTESLAADAEVDDDVMRDWVREIAAVRRQGLGNIRGAQARQVEQHARRNGIFTAEFRVGDLVLKYNARRDTRRGDRMQAPRSGPYEIIRVGGRGTYQLRCHRTGRVLRQMVNGSLLSVYRLPAETQPCSAGNTSQSHVEVVIQMGQ